MRFLRNLLAVSVLSITVVSFTTSLFAGQLSAPNPEETKSFWLLDAPKEWQAQIMPGIRGGSNKTLYYVDNLIPVLGTKDLLIFADDKTTFGANSRNEENIGLGLRNLFFDEKLILGGNFFYDTAYTENHVRHHQLAFGLEGLSKWVDARANFYFPISGEKLVSATATGGGGVSGDYAFRSRSLVQIISGGGITSIYEEPLRGLDYEGGVLIPYLSEYLETRVFIGGYNYFPDEGKGINGIKGRIEVRPLKALTINVEVRDDNYNPTEYFVEGFVSIPLETMNVFRIKNPFTDLKEYFGYKKGIRPLRQRMVDRVVRDIDIKAKTNTISTGSTGPGSETKIHDLTYVDNTYAGPEPSDGTMEHPYLTVADGVSNAIGDKWVFVRNGNTYNEHVNLTDNLTLWGSGYNGGFQGLVVSEVNPVIDGGGSGNVITLANNNTVMGMIVWGSGTSDEAGIYGHNINGANILFNGSINNGCHGIYLLFDDGGSHSNFTLTSNTMSGNLNGNGLYVSNDAGSTVSGFTFTNNTVGADTRNRTGVVIFNMNGSTASNFYFGDNTITGNQLYGIDLENWTGSVLSNFTFNGNNISGTLSGTGVWISNGGAGMSGFTFTGNTVNNNNYIGIGIRSYLAGNAVTGFTFNNNTISGNGNDGVDLEAWNNSIMSNCSFVNNSITGNASGGVYLLSATGGSMSSINLGDGTAGTGYNSIYGNNGGLGHNQIENYSGINNLLAQYNWWGTATPTNADVYTGSPNTVDYSNYLASDPNI